MPNFSDELLGAIKIVPKNLKPSQTFAKKQKGSWQWDFEVELGGDALLDDEDLSDLSIKVFARQNIFDPQNFSCGIRLVQEGKGVMLSRYNGSNHQHGMAVYQCHIHRSTAESISRGDRIPEHAETEVSTEYENLDGALRQLCGDYNIQLPEGELLFGILR